MRRAITTFPTGSGGELVGVQDVARVTSPAAGVDWTYTIPSGYFRRLISGTALFTTSATVANRFPGLQVTDTANLLYQFYPATALTAGLAVKAVITAGNIGAAVAVAIPSTGFGIPSVWLPPGYILKTNTVNIDAGDQWSAIVLWWECWDFGSEGQRLLEHGITRTELEATAEYGGRSAGTLPEHLLASERG